MAGDPSPGPSRTTGGGRASRGEPLGATQSPSIAPLPSPGDSQRQPSQVQQGLPAIPEQAALQQQRGAISNDGSPAGGGAQGAGGSVAPTPGRTGMSVPRMGSLAGGGSQGFAGGHTPGSSRRQRLVERGDLPNTVPRPRGRAGGLPAPAPAPSGDVAPVEVDGGHVPDNTFIWGTRVSAAAVSRDAQRFFTTFVDPKDPPNARPKYIQLIIQSVMNGDYIVNIDTGDLRTMDVELYKRLIEYPREVLPLFDEEARQLAIANCPDVDPNSPPYITVRVFNLEKKKTIRDLNPEDVDTLVSVQGMVTRTSSCIPELKAAHFRCQNPTCRASLDVLNMGGRVLQPEKCPKCKRNFSLQLIHNMSSFSNKQTVRMQEKPNDIPEGETPHSVNMYVFDANVDVCRPGDRVTITGTYRAAPIRADPVRRCYHATFRTFIDVMHVQRDEAGRLFTVAAVKEAQQAQQENGGTQTRGGGVSGVSGLSAPPSTSMMPSGSLPGGTQQDKFFGAEADLHAAQLGATTLDQLHQRERRIQQLAADPLLYERLVASLAPNIYGLDDVKKGLLCQLFGGCGKTFPGGRVRGEINLLMVGDPSVSKSQLLSYMHGLAPRGMYTSGKGSSATGLTASVSRDPETNELVLESGALVMSDRGICCIDEFDKMSDSARAMLHETMEQQTVSVAKAGLISTLNARTSICACANPIGSRYNPSLSVAENINLPPTLLTRFDLIYLLLDKVNEASDMQLARHLISMYHEGSTGATRAASALELISQDDMREYIAYARARITPRITSPAADELARVYANMRADGRQKRVVVATPRQLESLIRLSEAQARMRLSLTVEKSHVEEATRLWFHAMSMASPGEDGGIDQDALATGMTAARRRALQQLPQDLSRILSTSTGTTSVTELLEGLSHLAVTREQLLTSLRQLKDMLVLDERTGIVRSRAALAQLQQQQGGGGGGAAAAAPVMVAVGDVDMAPA